MMVRSFVMKVVPIAAMVIVECMDVGLTIISKAAISKGMNHYVFVVYSNALATLILLPSPLIFHSRTNRPSLTISLLCRFFILGLFGITLLQNCAFTGVNYSSPTLGSALSNLIPAFTFILAIIFSLNSQVKIMAILVTITGALVIILCKGPPIIQNISSTQASFPNSLKLTNWIQGGIFIATASLSASIWNIFQAATIKIYPAEMTVVSFYCFFGTIQCVLVSMIAVTDPKAWVMSSTQLSTHSAVFGSVITPAVQTWCINKKGPVFVSIFKPLGIAIAAITGVIFLGNSLYLGSVWRV